MSTTTSSPIAAEAQAFTQIKEVLNTIIPVVMIIPFVPQDIKNKISDVQNKLNAIPTIEQLIQADQDLQKTKLTLQKLQSDFFALQAEMTKLRQDYQTVSALSTSQKSQLAQYQTTLQAANDAVSNIQKKLDQVEKDFADYKSRSVGKVCDQMGTNTDLLFVVLLVLLVVCIGMLVSSMNKCKKLELQLAGQKA